VHGTAGVLDLLTSLNSRPVSDLQETAQVPARKRTTRSPAQDRRRADGSRARNPMGIDEVGRARNSI
jgi:hypothetical protein